VIDRTGMDRSVDHWLSKAEETRAIGETMLNTDAKQTVLEIAARYKELAVLAQAGEGSRRSSVSSAVKPSYGLPVRTRDQSPESNSDRSAGSLSPSNRAACSAIFS